MPVVGADDLPGVAVLVDARAPERYRGEAEPVDPVPATSRARSTSPTGRNLDNHGHFRAAAELRAVYGAVGATEARGGGLLRVRRDRDHDVLALELVGVRAALYAASWSGWVADPEHQVERSAGDPPG